MKYAIAEVNAAENYIKMAEKFCEEESTALKFQEMAKTELNHHKYDMEIIRCELKKKKDNGEYTLDLEDSLLYEVYKDWFIEVEARVNNFKIKK